MDTAKNYANGFNGKILSERGNTEQKSSKLELNSANHEMPGDPTNVKKGNPSGRRRCSRPSRAAVQQSGKDSKSDLLPDLVMDIPNPSDQRKNRQASQPLGKNGAGAIFSREEFAELEAAFATSRHPSQDELQELGQKMGKSSKEISTWFARRRIRATKEYVKNIDMASFVPPPPPPLPPEDMEPPCAEEMPPPHPQLASPSVQSSPPTNQPATPTSFKPDPGPAVVGTAFPTSANNPKNTSDYSVAFSIVNPDLPPLMLFLRRLNESAYAIRKLPEESLNVSESKETLHFPSLVAATPKTQCILESSSKAQPVDILYSAPRNKLSPDVDYLTRNACPGAFPPAATSEPQISSLSCPAASYRTRVLPKPPPLIRNTLADNKMQSTVLEKSVRRLPVTPIGVRPPKLMKISEKVPSGSPLWGPMMTGKPWSPPRQDNRRSCAVSSELKAPRMKKIHEEDESRRSPPAMIPIDWLYSDSRYTMPREGLVPYRHPEYLDYSMPYPMLPLPTSWLWNPYVPAPFAKDFVSKYPF